MNDVPLHITCVVTQARESFVKFQFDIACLLVFRPGLCEKFYTLSPCTFFWETVSGSSRREGLEQQHEFLREPLDEVKHEELDDDLRDPLRELTPDEAKHEALKEELEELQQEQLELRAAADAGAKAL